MLNHYLHGIDVSEWNGTIDWKKLKTDGVKFTYIKLSEGKSYKDRKASHNEMNAIYANTPIGGYQFYRFWADPKAQAQNFAAIGFPFSQAVNLPPAIDLEWQDTTGASNATLIKERVQLLKNLKFFLEIVERQTGRISIIYTQASFWDGILGSPLGFERYTLWVADYVKPKQPTLPKTWQKWKIWP